MTEHATATAAPRRLGPTASRARDAVRELVETGVFEPGQKLPGERELAERVSVSRVVLREALASLEEDGLLESSPWRGWFVTAPHMAERVTLQSFTEMALARGLRPGAHVHRSEVRPATLGEATSLALAPASPLLEVHRVRTLDEVAICYDVSVIPLQRAPGLEAPMLEDASLYGTLEAVCGLRVVRSDYTVRAEAADADIAGALGIAPGAPVLVGEEIASELGGTPVLLGRVTYRHDAYEFQATLYRPS
ncbi:GntR family transcriptional regulator [Agromyces mediolanus]|uniref:GntR family transcriptional regulator n=1 Tax=Agromyces mediolanus TaxID=41986 RepID=UPI0038395BFE